MRRLSLIVALLAACDGGPGDGPPVTPQTPSLRALPEVAPFDGEYKSTDFEVWARPDLITQDEWATIDPDRFLFFGDAGALVEADVDMHAFAVLGGDRHARLSVDLIDQRRRGQSFLLCLTIAATPVCASRTTLFAAAK